MIDETATLIAYLLTVNGVTTQVSTRVFGPPGLPIGYAGATKALVIMPDGGSQPTDMPIMTMPFQVRCYGPTPTAAHEVYAAVHDALHNCGPIQVTVGATKVVLARSQRLSGPVYLPELETGWQMWLARYGAILSDRTVT
jgi:hypothetical protein